MKTWYLTRDVTIIHNSVNIPIGSKLYLTPEQAQTHYDKLIKTEAPTDTSQVFFPEDFEQYKFNQYSDINNISDEIE